MGVIKAIWKSSIATGGLPHHANKRQDFSATNPQVRSRVTRKGKIAEDACVERTFALHWHVLLGIVDCQSLVSR